MNSDGYIARMDGPAHRVRTRQIGLGGFRGAAGAVCTGLQTPSLYTMYKGVAQTPEVPADIVSLEMRERERERKREREREREK